MAREIDRRVAEALGYEIVTVSYVGCDGESPRQKELDSWLTENNINSVGVYAFKVSENKWHRLDSKEYGDGDWHPQTDIAAAIGALEDYCNKMAWSAELRIGGEWRECDITEPEGDIVSTRSAATLSEAICAAILSASKGEGM